jgi:hypothetical protein
MQIRRPVWKYSCPRAEYRLVRLDVPNTIQYMIKKLIVMFNCCGRRA